MHILLVHVYVTICPCKYVWIQMYMPWGAPCSLTQFHWDVELLGWSEIGERMVGWSWSWPHPVQKAEWDRTSSTWVCRSPYLYMMAIHREIQWWVVTPMVSAWHYVHDLTHPKQSCTVFQKLICVQTQHSSQEAFRFFRRSHPILVCIAILCDTSSEEACERRLTALW